MFSKPWTVEYNLTRVLFTYLFYSNEVKNFLIAINPYQAAFITVFGTYSALKIIAIVRKKSSPNISFSAVTSHNKILSDWPWLHCMADQALYIPKNIERYTFAPSFVCDIDIGVVRLIICFTDVLGKFAFISVCAEIISTHLSTRWSAELIVVLRAISDASKLVCIYCTCSDAHLVGGNCRSSVTCCRICGR